MVYVPNLNMNKHSFSTFHKIKDKIKLWAARPLARKTGHILLIIFFGYSILGFLVIPLAAKVMIQTAGPKIIRHPVKVRGIYLNPFTFTLGVREFQITDKDKQRIVGFNRFMADFQISSLWRDTWHLKTVELDGLYSNIVLLKDGTVNLAALAPVPAPEKTGQKPEPDKPKELAKEKFILINSISFTNGAVAFKDEQGAVPFAYTVSPVNFHLENVSTRVDDAHAMKLTLLTQPSGRIELSSHCNINPLQCLLGVRIEALALSAFQPYINNYALISITDGTFNLDGEVVYKGLADGNHTLRFHGNTAIRDLTLTDAIDKNPLVLWKNFAVEGIHFNLYANQLTVEHVVLDGLKAGAVLEKDGQINFARLMKAQPAQPADVNKSPAPAAADTTKPPTKALEVKINHIELKNGAARFNDRSVVPEFSVAVSDMEANIRNVSTALDNQIDFDFLTALDEKGQISVEGNVTPFSKSTPAQVNFKLENYDMTALTPYMGKFLGYKVDEGTFNIDVQYDYSKEKMVGNHELMINKFTLGPEVDSPDALKVPIKLAIAILEDMNRRIDLALPVKGSPQDPSFKFSGLITKTLTNLMTKVVLSPFSLLGGIVGEGAEDLGAIAFAPGSTELTDPEKKKLLRLTKSLSVRPRISLEIKGYVDPDADGWVLKEKSFDLLVERMMKENKKFRPDTLKKLYVKDFGLRKLWALNRQYQTKNVTEEMARQMRLDLISVHKIEDALLADMAAARAKTIYDVLMKEGGLPPERVTLSETFEKTNIEDNLIKNKLAFSIKE